MLSLLLIVARVLAGLYAPITDCDETFNYLEPLHYLQHHVGLQTWEYVPSFAIRSYAFLLFPYSFLLHAAAFFTSNKVHSSGRAVQGNATQVGGFRWPNFTRYASVPACFRGWLTFTWSDDSIDMCRFGMRSFFPCW